MPAPIFVIGDVQGCFNALKKLVAQIDNHCQIHNLGLPELWLVGDLVNRGPDSLSVLRWCLANKHRLTVVLGNHDLHLLAVVAGIRKTRSDDTLNGILNAPDSEQLLWWLRQQPLARMRRGWLMVHAGLLPQWTAQHAIELSNEVSQCLRADGWKQFLKGMYGNEPARWSAGLRGEARTRAIINGLTRLRFCSENGDMEFASKEGAAQAPAGFAPWFTLASRQSRHDRIVFGHWSTLGLISENLLIATDTGCVWGGKLTAVQLQTNPEQRLVFEASEASEA